MTSPLCSVLRPAGADSQCGKVTPRDVTDTGMLLNLCKMAAVSSAAALRGADYENGLRGGSGSGQDVGDDEHMGRGGLDLDLELLGPGRRIRRIGGRIATGRRSGARGSTESGGAGALEELEEEEMEEEEAGEIGGDPAIDDPELEAIKARVREMEEEAVKLKELQNEVEKQMNMSPPPGNAGPVIMSIEEKMEADARSIYVGNVDYGATAEELEAHFHGCGSVNRVTILCDKFTGHPKGSLAVFASRTVTAGRKVKAEHSGSAFTLRPAVTECGKQTARDLTDTRMFAYIEFSDKESVRTSMALDESLFRGRQIKVVPKRTNRPGISTTDRGYPRARYRARASSYSSRSRFYTGYPARPRGRVYRGRARVTSWYSPY
ncbi:unnamed protein product [Ranitomeya imitator]|uniref:RRM domain-containing protein n=1 Tax=Ranitomeya imitator TaxID=111125 RepID=A0ABN9LZ18_9NEOB|nr:unnamed protein product [Ranitomeya imitator]